MPLIFNNIAISPIKEPRKYDPESPQKILPVKKLNKNKIIVAHKSAYILSITSITPTELII